MSVEQLRRDAIPLRAHSHYDQWETGTGAKTVFFLKKSPGRDGNLRVFVAGLLKRPNDRGSVYDYSVSGTTVTFTVAPAAAAAICFSLISA
jgi:hypothetical protein